MSDLKPIPRKEQYLSQIDGMTNSSPDKIYTKEEYLFSEILGEALHKPALKTRYEMYLAKIAGREVGIPYPETRLERFLAKAAGMDISVPTPITREEMYWSTYSPFYLSNASGASPLTYGKGKIGNLSNYRIYGQTVDGESVGDRTGNLFDCDNTEDTEVNGIVWSCKNQIITANGATGNLASSTFGHKRITGLYGSFILACVSDTNNDCICVVSVQETQSSTRTYNVSTTNSYATFSLTGEEYEVIVYAQVNKNKEVNNAQFFISLTEGSTPPDTYEPYGYKVPVTVEGKNLYKISTFRDGSTSAVVSAVTFTINNNAVSISGISSAKHPQVTSQRFELISGETYSAKIFVDGSYDGEMYIIMRGGERQDGSDEAIYKRISVGSGDTFVAKTYNSIIYVADGTNKEFNAIVRVILIKGSMLPDTYEPYHAPITTPIYLPEPIKMVGDEAEYIDFMEQKQHFADGTSVDVTLPALPTLTGTNVLSVGTEVQPSHIFAEFDKEREYG